MLSEAWVGGIFALAGVLLSQSLTLLWQHLSSRRKEKEDIVAQVREAASSHLQSAQLYTNSFNFILNLSDHSENIASQNQLLAAINNFYFTESILLLTMPTRDDGFRRAIKMLRDKTHELGLDEQSAINSRKREEFDVVVDQFISAYQLYLKRL